MSDDFDLYQWCKRLIKNFPIKTNRITHQMYVWHGDVYLDDAHEFIQESLIVDRGNDYKSSDLATAIQIIEGLTFCELEEPATHLVLCRNGILNLNDKTLAYADHAYFFTSKVDVDFNPDAKCPIFMEDLNAILPDPKKQLCLQEQFGYCLLRAMPFHKIFFWVGSGRNGKGTMARTLINLLGVNNVSAIPLESLSERFQVVNIYHKLANIASEPKIKAYLDTTVLKKATGEDLLYGEMKGKQKQLAFINGAKPFVQANRLPKVDDDSLAWWDRVVILPFLEEFTSENGKLIPNIEDRWLSSEEERSGIFNFAIAGLERLQKNKQFTKSDDMVNAEKEYRRYSDPVACFLNDCCEVKVSLFILKVDLYEAYKEYSCKNEFEIINESSFRLRIKKIPRVREDIRRVAGTIARVWVGINLKEDLKENVTLVTLVTPFTTSPKNNLNSRGSTERRNKCNNCNNSIEPEPEPFLGECSVCHNKTLIEFRIDGQPGCQYCKAFYDSKGSEGIEP